MHKLQTFWIFEFLKVVIVETVFHNAEEGSKKYFILDCTKVIHQKCTYRTKKLQERAVQYPPMMK
jgi:hypothetical protein